MTHVVGDPGHTTDHNTIEATQATHASQIAGKLDSSTALTTYAPLSLARTLLYTAPSGTGTNAEIWLARPDGTGATQLTTDATYQSWWPKWSPNGKRILFLRQPAAQTNYDDSTQFAATSLWTMNSDGTSLVQIVAAGTLGATAGTKTLFTPNWMPNGRDIVVCGGANNLVFIIKDDGSNAAAASPIVIAGVASGAADCSPSPDGTTIAFTYSKDVWLVNVAGGAKTQVTTTNGTATNPDGGFEQYYDPCWSPDGTQLALLRKNADPAVSITGGQFSLETCYPVASAATTAATVITDIYSKASWGLDGQLYMHGFAYSTDTTFSLFRVRADASGATPTRLTGPGAGRQNYPDIFVHRQPAVFFRGNGSAAIIANLAATFTGGLTTNGALTTVGGLLVGNGTTVGTVVYGGSGVPSAGLGANGNFYLRNDTPGTASQRVYVKAAGAWVGIL